MSSARPTIDITDLTLDQLDEVNRLMTDDGIGRVTAFAYVGLKALGRDLTLDEAGALTGRDIKIIETDPEVDDEGPTSAL
jgi:hypothetical protein